MRKALEFAALAGLVVLFAITAWAFFGPNPLSARIAIHFGFDGRPNRWGSSAMLWFQPAVAAFIYVLMTVVSRFPASFNFPVRVTPRTRPKLEALALQMIVWLKAELMILLSWVQWATIRSARDSALSLSPWFVPIFLAAIWVTIGCYVVAMRKTARAPQSN